MAFCPNCGTPNTEQANKCVNCGKALTPAGGGGGGKFKGTIMMGMAGAPAPKPNTPAAPPAEQGGGEAKNLAFQKTMLGPAAGPPPAAPAAPPPAEQPSAEIAHAPTMEHDATPPPAQPQAAAPAQSFSQPSFHDHDDAPQLPQSNATKTMVMVLGASVVIAALIVGAALFMR